MKGSKIYLREMIVNLNMEEILSFPKGIIDSQTSHHSSEYILLHLNELVHLRNEKKTLKINNALQPTLRT